MRFSQLFVAASALCVGLSFAVALPTTTDVPASIKACEDKGIDPYGPIPDDYSSHINGTYHFKAGTKAAIWVYAQGDLPPKETGHEKRQGWANIGIGMWAQDNCGGEGVWADNVQYGYNNAASLNLYSVKVAYRGLRSGEQLDFSRLKGSDWCGQYVYSAAPYTPPGCWNSQLINCFRLWLH